MWYQFKLVWRKIAIVLQKIWVTMTEPFLSVQMQAPVWSLDSQWQFHFKAEQHRVIVEKELIVTISLDHYLLHISFSSGTFSEAHCGWVTTCYNYAIMHQRKWLQLKNHLGVSNYLRLEVYKLVKGLNDVSSQQNWVCGCTHSSMLAWVRQLTAHVQ